MIRKDFFGLRFGGHFFARGGGGERGGGERNTLKGDAVFHPRFQDEMYIREPEIHPF